MDFDSQYERMVQGQLNDILNDFVSGKGKHAQSQLPLFKDIPILYEVQYQRVQEQPCEPKPILEAHMEFLGLKIDSTDELVVTGTSRFFRRYK